MFLRFPVLSDRLMIVEGLIFYRCLLSFFNFTGLLISQITVRRPLVKIYQRLGPRSRTSPLIILQMVSVKFAVRFSHSSHF